MKKITWPNFSVEEWHLKLFRKYIIFKLVFCAWKRGTFSSVYIIREHSDLNTVWLKPQTSTN